MIREYREYQECGRQRPRLCRPLLRCRLPAYCLWTLRKTYGNEPPAFSKQVAVLPVGSFEQHGPFLPLATDTLVACAIAREIAATHPVHLLPPVTIACSHEHAAWPGTVSISSVTLHAVVRDIADSLRRSGVDALVVVNGHGGNYVLGNVVQESSARGERIALFPAAEDWETARERAHVVTSLLTDMHAGEIETSILLHAHPELLRPGYETADFVADDRRHLLTLGMRRLHRFRCHRAPFAGFRRKGEGVAGELRRVLRSVFSMLTEDGSEAGSEAEGGDVGVGDQK